MLVAQGKITPINSEHGLFNYKLGLVKFTITEEGRNWLNNYIFYEGRNVTNSLDAYYERLNQQKITLGEISNSYLVEAINCYFNNCPRASMVMLGVALEALFDELDESIKSTSIPEWKSLESNSKDRSYSKRLKRFSAFIDDKVKIIEQITGVENPKIFLAPMLEHIRQIRNDGAHAALPNHDLTEAYAMLELFIRVAKIISKLRDYLKYSSIL